MYGLRRFSNSLCAEVGKYSYIKLGRERLYPFVFIIEKNTEEMTIDKTCGSFSCDFCCGDKNTLTKSSLGKNRLVWIAFRDYSSSLKIGKEFKMGIRRQGPWRKAVFWLILWSSRFHVWLAFLYSPGPPEQGWCHAQWTGPSYIK